ncbi:hypothetical protein MAR_034034, partial [Mya arenaria]
MSSERDDRWSSFKTALVQQKLLQEMRDKNAQDVTTLDDCLRRILMMKAQRKQQENACKAANSLVKQITGFAHALNPEWKTYIPAGSDGGVNTVPLRSLAKDAYECMVPLVRPMRLDGFQVVQRPLDEMAQHRCLIQLNDNLSRQERNLVASQWEDFIDVSGCLGPRAILKWFNKGLADTVPVVLSENHNVDKLACAVGDDGTATLNATVTEFNGEQL